MTNPFGVTPRLVCRCKPLQLAINIVYLFAVAKIADRLNAAQQEKPNYEQQIPTAYDQSA